MGNYPQPLKPAIQGTKLVGSQVMQVSTWSGAWNFPQLLKPAIQGTKLLGSQAMQVSTWSGAWEHLGVSQNRAASKFAVSFWFQLPIWKKHTHGWCVSFSVLVRFFWLLFLKANRKRNTNFEAAPFFGGCKGNHCPLFGGKPFSALTCVVIPEPRTRNVTPASHAGICWPKPMDQQTASVFGVLEGMNLGDPLKETSRNGL